MTNEGNIRSLEKNVFAFPSNYLNAINNRDIFKTQLDSTKEIKCHPTCKFYYGCTRTFAVSRFHFHSVLINIRLQLQEYDIVFLKDSHK